MTFQVHLVVGRKQVEITCPDPHVRLGAFQTGASAVIADSSHQCFLPNGGTRQRCTCDNATGRMLLSSNTVQIAIGSSMCAAYLLSDIENSALPSGSPSTVVVRGSTVERVAVLMTRYTGIGITAAYAAVQDHREPDAESGSKTAGAAYLYRASALADVRLTRDHFTTTTITFYDQDVLSHGPFAVSAAAATAGLLEQLIEMVGQCVSGSGTAQFSSEDGACLDASEMWTAVEFEVNHVRTEEQAGN